MKRWFSVIHCSRLYLFKAKGNLNSNSPAVTLILKNFEILPKKDNRSGSFVRLDSNRFFQLKDGRLGHGSVRL